MTAIDASTALCGPPSFLQVSPPSDDTCPWTVATGAASMAAFAVITAVCPRAIFRFCGWVVNLGGRSCS
ncbi:hypothetical protein D3C75_1348800 [compost metagenome]